MRHSLDLNSSTVRRVVLIYSRVPAPFWRWRPVKVRTVVYDDPYWLEMMHGSARVVRHGWPVHDLGGEAITFPNWADDLRRLNVLQIYVTDDRPAGDQDDPLPMWGAMLAVLALPYRWQAIGITLLAGLLASVAAIGAPRGVRQAKAAIGVRSVRVLSAYQLWQYVESVKRDVSSSP